MHFFLVQHEYIITTVVIMYTPERGTLLLCSHSSNCSGVPRSYWELAVSFHDRLLRTLISSQRSNLPFISRSPCGENPGLRMLVF